jgi:hypothetical protein
MLENFYHATVRKVVVGFATLFNNIHVVRRNDSGQEIERIKVPIAYGPQQKFLRRLDRIGTSFEEQAVRLEQYLPRMSFEISNLQYDSTRKLNSIQRTVAHSDERSKLRSRWERVPYNMTMSLGVMTKSMDDCLQIVEQILPYFTPEYVFTIRAISGMDEDVDIPIVFSSVSLADGDDGSQGDYSSRKVNLASMQFVAKMYLYGPVKTSPIILDADVNVFDTNDFGKPTSTIKPFADISVTAAESITAGSYDPSMTAGAYGSTHTNVEIREYPPTPWPT